MIIDVKSTYRSSNIIVKYTHSFTKAWYFSCVCCVSSCLCVVNHYHLESFAIDATFSASKNGCREHLKQISNEKLFDKHYPLSNTMHFTRLKFLLYHMCTDKDFYN